MEGNDIYNMVSNPPGATLVQVFNPPLDNPAAGQAGALRPVGLNALDPNYKVPYIQTYSLQIQGEVTPANSVSLQNTAASTYHSLQATFKRRMSKGLLFETAYTWSKAIGDGSDFGEQPQNAYNFRAERALTTFDRTHVLVFNYIYEFPIFRDRSKLSGKVWAGGRF